MILRTAAGYISNIVAAMDEKIKKIISIGMGGHRYYVQEMPGFWNLGRDYAVMMDRKRLHAGRFNSRKDAVLWLLSYLSRELEQPELELLDL